MGVTECSNSKYYLYTGLTRIIILFKKKKEKFCSVQHVFGVPLDDAKALFFFILKEVFNRHACVFLKPVINIISKILVFVSTLLCIFS